MNAYTFINLSRDFESIHFSRIYLPSSRTVLAPKSVVQLNPVLRDHMVSSNQHISQVSVFLMLCKHATMAGFALLLAALQYRWPTTRSLLLSATRCSSLLLNRKRGFLRSISRWVCMRIFLVTIHSQSNLCFFAF